MNDASAFVLAGGRSSRMGQDKAFLRLGHHTLLEHAIALAKAAAGQVFLVGDRRRLSPYGAVVEDIHRNCGPLGGIHAALCAATTELNLILAVDTPFARPEFLQALLAEARGSHALATVPRLHGKFEPLCAVYRKAFVDAAQRALGMGQYKVGPLFSQVETHILDDTALNAMGASPATFVNLNTPEEWRRAQQQFEATAK